jgi:hypothetical protein
VSRASRSAARRRKPPVLDVRVVERGRAARAPAELARVLSTRLVQSAHRGRLALTPRVEVRAGPTLVGVAVYRPSDSELRVPALGWTAIDGAGAHDVLARLLDTLEAVCVAGGWRRLVLVPPSRAQAVLRRRGYEVVSEGCAGAWMEKTFA